jgi:hypothetical protein
MNFSSGPAAASVGASYFKNRSMRPDREISMEP